MSEVRVVPVDRTATWRVHDTDASMPESEYETQTAAELAARDRAARRAGTRVVIYDRYHRIREIAIAHGSSFSSSPEVDRRMFRPASST